MDQLRSLFVNENIGGHQTMHLHLRRALTSFPDIEPHFIDVPPRGPLRRIVGVRLPGLAALDLDLQPLRAQLALSLHVRRQLRQLVASFDVLHVYTQNAGLAITHELRSRPSVVSTDSTNELNAYSLPHRAPTRWTHRALGPTRAIERRVYEAATLVVAQSAWVAASLRDDYGVPEHRLRVIPPGITVNESCERRLPPGPPEITFVGSSMQRKGGTQLLDIFRRHLRGRAVLNLVTADPVPTEPGVNVFRDFRSGDPRLDDLLARTAVFALPSEIDKSSFAILEAMARGVPVVTTRVGALPELVPDRVAGRLVEAADADALTEALIELLEDEAMREKLGDGARARVLERFDARITTAQLVAVLHEAVRA